MGPMSHRGFEKLVKSWNCSIQKTTKEWEVKDKTDGMRVSGFASHGKSVKPVYINIFLKEIRRKRGKQNPKDADKKEEEDGNE